MTVTHFIVEPYCWAVSVHTTGYQGKTGFMSHCCLPPLLHKSAKSRWFLAELTCFSQWSRVLDWWSSSSQSALKHNLNNWNFITLLCVHVSVMENIQPQTRYGNQLARGPRTTIYAPFESMKKNKFNKPFGLLTQSCFLFPVTPASFWREYKTTR